MNKWSCHFQAVGFLRKNGRTYGKSAEKYVAELTVDAQEETLK